jgi:hypothetical protein
MPGSSSKAQRSRLRRTTRDEERPPDRIGSGPSDEACLDTLDRGQVVSHDVPGLTLVSRMVQLTRRRANIYAGRIVRVRAQRVPEDGEPCPALRQSLRPFGPLPPAIRGAVYGHRPIRSHAVVVSDERDGVRRLRVVRMGCEREAKRPARALGNR